LELEPGQGTVARDHGGVTLQSIFIMAVLCLALVPIVSVLAAVILISTALLPFLIGSEFAPSFSPHATVHLDIVILVLIASLVIGYSVSFLFNPSTPILATVCNHMFGDSAIRKPLEDSMIRLRKAQRNQLNIYASAMLVCAACVALVMSPAGSHQQLTAVSRSRALSLDDAPAQQVADSDTDTASHHWLGMGKALLLIFLAEIGDKTFFVAMILAMKYDQSAVFVGSMAALALMTILSAGLGYVLVGLVRRPQTCRLAAEAKGRSELAAGANPPAEGGRALAEHARRHARCSPRLCRPPRRARIAAAPAPARRSAVGVMV
jgi:hypothetical protein